MPIINNPGGGGGAVWGAVTGTLSAQTDLQSALDLKAALISPSFTTPALGNATATSLAVPTLTTVGTVTGGAGNMTITAGTGNSRTLAFQTTTSGGVATTALTLGADQKATFTNHVALGTGSDAKLTFNGGSGAQIENFGTDLYLDTESSFFFRGGGIGGTIFATFSVANSGRLKINQNSGASANVGGVIFDDFTAANTSHTDGTEDDLFTHTIGLLTFRVNGDTVEQFEHVSTVGSATAARRIKKYFGGTLIFDSGALTLSLGGEFDICTMVMRKDAATALVTVLVTSTSASTVPYATKTTVSATLTNTQILKTTGIASGTGAASADISNFISKIWWWPAAS